MPAQKTSKSLKSSPRKLTKNSRVAVKKTVTKTRAAAKKTVRKGAATAKKAIARGKSISRAAAKKLPARRRATKATAGFVDHLKENVQSGIDAVGRMVKKVTPDALLPKSAKSGRKAR